MINKASAERKVLQHPDLEIDLVSDTKGNDMYIGKSKRYEPYEASAGTAIDCFFKFNIQLSEQKIIASFLKN
jgi:hypothetical protein